MGSAQSARRIQPWRSRAGRWCRMNGFTVAMLPAARGGRVRLVDRGARWSRPAPGALPPRWWCAATGFRGGQDRRGVCGPEVLCLRPAPGGMVFVRPVTEGERPPPRPLRSLVGYVETRPLPQWRGRGALLPAGSVDRCGLFPVRHRPRLGARLRVCHRLRVPGVRGEGRPPTRPVLKHGPRSLTRARVQGSVETPRRNEGEGRIRRRPRWDPPAPWSGWRTAGPPRPPRRGGGARAYVLGPERW